jgi:UDP-GlcNAc:undecaprenyl-phosphate GlcNAc-1-phosphate transferase
MCDGIDGLASGLVLSFLVSLSASLYALHGQVLHWEWLGILFVTVLAFFLVNMSAFPVKKVFLGDGGSLLLGFIVSWIAIFYSQDPVGLISPILVAWFVAIPVLDVLHVVCRRIRCGVSPFSADRAHLHHLLARQAGADRIASFILIIAALVISFVGFGLYYFLSPLVSLLAFIFCLLVIVICLQLVESAEDQKARSIKD